MFQSIVCRFVVSGETNALLCRFRGTGSMREWQVEVSFDDENDCERSSEWQDWKIGKVVLAIVKMRDWGLGIACAFELNNRELEWEVERGKKKASINRTYQVPVPIILCPCRINSILKFHESAVVFV